MRILAIAAVGAAAAIAVAVAIALGGGGGTTSKADYQATIVNARDRVDFALDRITKSRSAEDLITRIDEASETVGGVAGNLDKARVAEGFDDENDKLVRTLRALSDDLSGTAATLGDPSFAETLPGINSLSYPEWDKVNAILAGLEEQGIHVQPLARH